MKSARQIYQANLDAVSFALMSGDLALMRRHLALPNFMSTEDSEVVMSSVEEMDILMQDFRAELHRRQVREFRRVCREVRFIGGHWDMILGVHDTWCVGMTGQVCVEPYENHMTLMKIDGAWKSIRIEASIRNSDLPILSPDLAAAHHARHGASRA